LQFVVAYPLPVLILPTARPEAYEEEGNDVMQWVQPGSTPSCK